MQRLDGAVRKYEWGSRTLLPRFLGTETDGESARRAVARAPTPAIRRCCRTGRRSPT